MRARVLLFTALLLVPTAPAQAGGGRCHTPYTDGSGTEVITEGSCFRPMVLRAQPGDTVTWSVSDGIGHNVATPLPFGGDLPAGEILTAQFDEPGVYPYTCTLHPGMVGVVIVGDGGPTDTAFASTVSVPSSDSDPVLLWTLLSVLALIAVTGGSSLRHNKQRADGTAPS